MKIKMTKFAENQFNKIISDIDIEDFEKEVNNHYIRCLENSNKKNSYFDILDGYAPFCKLMPMSNFTNAKVGSLPITLENYQYIRSGYSARRESELPVFTRWFELPVEIPKAKWLMIILYSKEQIDKEASKTEDYTPFDADYGIISILGQNHPNEEPMKPSTMIRNALGIEEGGSDVKLNKEDYLESVKFWNKNCTLK